MCKFKYEGLHNICEVIRGSIGEHTCSNGRFPVDPSEVLIFIVRYKLLHTIIDLYYSIAQNFTDLPFSAFSNMKLVLNFLEFKNVLRKTGWAGYYIHIA